MINLTTLATNASTVNTSLSGDMIKELHCNTINNRILTFFVVPFIMVSFAGQVAKMIDTSDLRTYKQSIMILYYLVAVFMFMLGCVMIMSI